MTDTQGSETRLEQELEALETSLESNNTMATTFRATLQSVRLALSQTNRETEAMGRAIGGDLRRAMDNVVLDGGRVSDALRNVGRSMVETAYKAAMRPVQDSAERLISGTMGGLLSGLVPFQSGGVISQGRVTPFARGGVVGGPTMFPMRGGMGLMGEAGPEAILPLRRGADGKLGVASSASRGPVHVTMNITTPDAESFRRSSSQVAAEMQRALARGQRNR